MTTHGSSGTSGRRSTRRTTSSWPSQSMRSSSPWARCCLPSACRWRSGCSAATAAAWRSVEPGRRQRPTAASGRGSRTDKALESVAHGEDKERGEMTESKDEPKPKGRGGKMKEAAKGVFYGMAAQGHVTAALRTRMYLEHLFMFITLGDMLGVPVIPPYYSLKILPYAVPNIKSWKQRVFRERDFT